MLGVARDASETEIKKAFRRLARELHPDVNTQDPDAEDKFKEAAEAYEVLVRPRAPRDVRPLRPRGRCAAAARQPSFEGFGSFADIFDAFFGGGDGGAASAAAAAARCRAGTSRVAVDVDLAEAAAASSSVEVAYEAVARVRALPRQRRRARHADRDLPALRRQRATCRPLRGRRSARSCELPYATPAAVTAAPPRTRASAAADAGARSRRRSLRVDIPAGIDDGQRIRLSGRGHAGDHGGPAGDLYVQVRVARR